LAAVPAPAGGNDLACDFLTVETVWLTRIYVLFFISLERRRVEFVASMANPNGRWVAQQARNLLMLLDDRKRSFRFLLHDRDSKFGGGFNQILSSEGMTIVRTPVRAPNANAYAERWVSTLRRECLDRILIVNRRQLEHVLRVYAAHYNRHRPHRSLSLQPPDESVSAAARAPAGRIRKHELLGGLQRIRSSSVTTPLPMTEFSNPTGAATQKGGVRRRFFTDPSSPKRSPLRSRSAWRRTHGRGAHKAT